MVPYKGIFPRSTQIFVMKGITWSHFYCRKIVMLVDMVIPKKYWRRKVTEDIILISHIKVDDLLNCDNNRDGRTEWRGLLAIETTELGESTESECC